MMRDRWRITVCSECQALLEDDRDYGLLPASVDDCHRPDGQKCSQVPGGRGLGIIVPGSIYVNVVREES